ncbi:MAG: DUF1015 domain-containing protein, partial [Clostridiales bacterium]|nr:DUF1015 domain-containing protein [Clostridiales bacterium]
YDVIDRNEAKKIAEGNEYSFLHISRSEIDLPDHLDQYDPLVYEKARNNIDTFLSKGILIRDEKPMLYIYRQTTGKQAQTGIVACVSIDDYLNNVIKKHELTRVEKEKDRINHFDICNANTEPVFLTNRDRYDIRSMIDAWIKSYDPVYDIKTADGVNHTLWIVDNETTIKSLVNLFEDISSLYIADGHHRSASAVNVGLKRRKENPNYTGDEEFNYFLAVIFPDKDLIILDYNRLVKDLKGLSPDQILSKISLMYDIEKIKDGPYRPERKHILSMYLGGSWYKLVAKQSIIPDDPVKRLDVSILQDTILSPILGIDDPRTDNRISFVGGSKGLEELESLVDEDMADVAFALYPVDIEDLLTISDEGKIMPPKSTWFEPKLGSGLFMHELV